MKKIFQFTHTQTHSNASHVSLWAIRAKKNVSLKKKKNKEWMKNSKLFKIRKMERVRKRKEAKKYKFAIRNILL